MSCKNLSPPPPAGSFPTFSILHDPLRLEFCWFHGPSIISTASNVVFWTCFRAKTCCVVCHAYCFCYGGTNMARKNVWKTTFHSTLRWFNFSQSASRKNNRKAFEGASMEPTNLNSSISLILRLVGVNSWFAMSLSKIQINDFPDKTFTRWEQPHFEVHLQVSDWYTNECKSYSCSKFRKCLYIYSAAAMLVGKRIPSSPFSQIT